MQWRKINSQALLVSGCFTLMLSNLSCSVLTYESRQTTIARREVLNGQLASAVYATSDEALEQSANVLNVTKVTNFDKESASDINSLTMSTQGLLFSQFDNSKRAFDVWMRTTGGMKRIIADQYINTNPVLSQDGRFIYFSSNRQGSLKIWRIPSSGTGGLTPITGNSSGNDSTPDLSPKENKMLFSSSAPGYPPQVWMSNMNGSDMTMLSNGYQPKWSPDGQKVYYVDKVGNIAQIWSMNKDGTSKVQITMCKASCEQPDISPDGKKMVYVSRDSGNQDVWLYDFVKQESTQLTTNSAADINPVFDRNGKTIYFVSSRALSWNIWRMDLVN
jgi:Tol biopolymer transport system component